MYIFRLDDASDYMDTEKWNKIEKMFDKYFVKPIVGIIPNNEDLKFIEKYQHDLDFWSKANRWKEKGWRVALHGYNHVYLTQCGGVNPVNYRSEFAGLSLNEQRDKIKKGYDILCLKGLKPDIFFAPSHTFDNNTIEALRIETDIRIVSDTIANNVYFDKEFYFVPQQIGVPRKLPFKLTTICLHPNNMSDIAFDKLERFIIKNRDNILSAYDIRMRENKQTIYDRFLRNTYFCIRKIKR